MSRPVFIAAVALAAIAGGWWLLRNGDAAAPSSGRNAGANGASTSAALASGPAANPERRESAADAHAADFPLAAALNAPDSTIQRDLDTLGQIFDAWRTNFPREGNPVGENHEITAALLGDNRLGLALFPKNHRALNERGELCDRWGTPFRFHQVSGERMDIVSAGPDKKFGTGDDIGWSPGP